MLLAVNPRALFDKTNDGDTLFDLAKKQATKSHPNYALIDELTHQLMTSEEKERDSARLDSNDKTNTYESSQEEASPAQ
jgi:hypothetical protein